MTWYHNLYEPLVDLGHDVFMLRMDEVASNIKVKFRSNKFREVFNDVLLNTFRKENNKKHFDLFLSYFTNLDIDPHVIKLISKFNCPTANFSCNNTHQFHLVREISPYFDYNLHSEKDATSKFNEIGANSVWFPMAANPKYYYPVKGQYIYDISFVGAAYGKRPFYIHHLVQNGLIVDCFGPNWLINKPYSLLKKYKKEVERIGWILHSLLITNLRERQKLSLKTYNYDLLTYLRLQNSERFHYPVPDIKMPVIFSQSKINLGFLEVYSGNNYQQVQKHLHLREFEVPMCGGLYITNYSEELAEFYEPGKEILTFFNEYDLTDKLKYFLDHDVQAESIRKNGYLRAINSHTYHKRFANLFLKINL